MSRMFNALAAGLELSTKYQGLFLDRSTQGDTEYIQYYSDSGKLHNNKGPAEVIIKDNQVISQKFYNNGNDVTETIEGLMQQGALSDEKDEHGAYMFDEVDQFTIMMSMES